jgi:hypothetical protein
MTSTVNPSSSRSSSTLAPSRHDESRRRAHETVRSHGLENLPALVVLRSVESRRALAGQPALRRLLDSLPYVDGAVALEDLPDQVRMIDEVDLLRADSEADEIAAPQDGVQRLERPPHETRDTRKPDFRGRDCGAHLRYSQSARRAEAQQ